MQEVVLGVGRQDSVRDIVAVALAELKSTKGIPRKITGRSETVDFTAEREDFEGDFERFQIRIRASGKITQSLQAIADECSDVCEYSQDGGFHVFICPPLASEDFSGAREVVDKLSAPIKLPEVWRVKGEKYRIDPISVELLFQALVQYKASDLHLVAGETPIFRIDGQTRHSDLMGELSSSQIEALVHEIAPESAWEEFQTKHQCGFNFHQVGIGYARVAAFYKLGAPHLTFRFLPEEIPTFDALHIPSDIVEELASLHLGMIIIAGMTGSGKTTTLASMVDWINSRSMLHILTIEEPIEYVYPKRKAMVSQRAMGSDVDSFADGVREALRHDPDVIVIGEMRDSDTIRAAISAASTGHLVLSTLHANTASEVANRIVSFFDPVERDLVRRQLCDTLKCVICQRLVPVRGGGRMPAMEMLFNDIKPVSQGIIDGDTLAIRIGMQQTVGQSYLFETYLHKMFKDGLIGLEVARQFSTDLDIFVQMHMGTYSVPRVESMSVDTRH